MQKFVPNKKGHVGMVDTNHTYVIANLLVLPGYGNDVGVVCFHHSYVTFLTK